MIKRILSKMFIETSDERLRKLSGGGQKSERR